MSEAAAVKCDHSRWVTVSAKNLQLDHVSKALHRVQSKLLPADAIVSRGAKIPPAIRAANPNGKSRAVRAPNFHISTAMTLTTMRVCNSEGTHKRNPARSVF